MAINRQGLGRNGFANTLHWCDPMPFAFNLLFDCPLKLRGGWRRLVSTVVALHRLPEEGWFLKRLFEATSAFPNLQKSPEPLTQAPVLGTPHD
jgi:hypothetical protein